ncbi:MAG: hypothetical protein WC322_06220 [Candidatus Paceibacterota bacterium]|jgi:hydroxymethylpyrimidine/phosphomethylpyrimidine kinase
MAMRKGDLQEAIDEARRFITKAIALQDAGEVAHTHYECYYNHPAEQAAVRRSSMDLTKSLSKLRKGT